MERENRNIILEISDNDLSVVRVAKEREGWDALSLNNYLILEPDYTIDRFPRSRIVRQYNISDHDIISDIEWYIEEFESGGTDPEDYADFSNDVVIARRFATDTEWMPSKEQVLRYFQQLGSPAWEDPDFDIALNFKRAFPDWISNDQLSQYYARIEQKGLDKMIFDAQYLTLEERLSQRAAFRLLFPNKWRNIGISLQEAEQANNLLDISDPDSYLRSAASFVILSAYNAEIDQKGDINLSFERQQPPFINTSWRGKW